MREPGTDMSRTREHNIALKRLRLINERVAAKRPLGKAPACRGDELCFCVECLGQVAL